jgi:transposase
MGEITTVGLDLAKSVFQVHAVDAEGRVVIRRQVRRPQLVKFFAGLPPCLRDRPLLGPRAHCPRP